MIFNSEFNLENLPRQNFNFCGAIMFNDENEEFYPEMDLGAICKSIRIKTLYFVSLSSHLFLFTLMIICMHRNARVLNDTMHKRYGASNKPKNFIVALLFCCVIGASCNHVNIFSRILRARIKCANISRNEMDG